MRRTESKQVEGSNSLWQVYKTVSFFRTMWNFIVIQLGRYMPFVSWKRWMYIHLLGMKIGEKTAFALMVMPDIMFPQLIEIGANSIVGYNTTILCHEYLIEEYRTGKVIIGSNVMIGANCTILPGVIIGDGATVAAGTVVHRDIPPNTVAKGNKLVIVEK